MSLPEKLLLVLKKERDAPQHVTHKVFTFRPAFAVPVESESLVRQALKWGGEDCEVRDNWPNLPYNGLDLFHQEERGGKTVYKVITPQGWLFDLRPEVFERALYGSRVARGRIEGGYSWVQKGNSMRLLYEGGSEWKEHEDMGPGAQAALIPERHLEYGKKYRTKNGREFIFRGWAHGVGHDYRLKWENLELGRYEAHRRSHVIAKVDERTYKQTLRSRRVWEPNGSKAVRVSLAPEGPPWLQTYRKNRVAHVFEYDEE
jgi:hypothetical protein